jgi:hypothetical protein
MADNAAPVDDEMDYAALRNAFRSKLAGAPAGNAERLAAERRAGLSPKQRARRGTAKTQLNVRATDETRATIDALAGHLDVSITEVIARAVAALAKSTPGFEGKE